MRKTINLLLTAAIIAGSISVPAFAAAIDKERLREKHKEYFEESERREDFVEKERREDFVEEERREDFVEKERREDSSKKERRNEVLEKKLEDFRGLIEEYQEKIHNGDEKSHYLALRVKILEHLIEVFSNILQ